MQIECKDNEVVATGVMLDETGTMQGEDEKLIEAFAALGSGIFTIILRKEV